MCDWTAFCVLLIACTQVEQMHIKAHSRTQVRYKHAPSKYRYTYLHVLHIHQANTITHTGKAYKSTRRNIQFHQASRRIMHVHQTGTITLASKTYTTTHPPSTHIHAGKRTHTFTHRRTKATQSRTHWRE